MSSTYKHEYKDTCPIWGTPASVELPYKKKILIDSPRAGGKYEISIHSRDQFEYLNDQQKSHLTTMLVNRRIQVNEIPYISSDDVARAKTEENISVINRANRLLHYFVKKSKGHFAGYVLNIDSDSKRHGMLESIQSLRLNSESYHEGILVYYEGLAYSESLSWKEIKFLIDYLSEQNFIEILNYTNDYEGITCRVTIDGYRRIEKNTMNPDSSQSFVAMWFGEQMNNVYEEGIERAIKNTGYKPMRIDKKPNVNKIDDEIIAEIRRSRFLIADFTHGQDGARGGVYYEAGFAHGLGIPVIFSCRKDIIDKLHFDTRQYYHIVWENPEQLRDGLEKRILALIGQGPLIAPAAP